MDFSSILLNPASVLGNNKVWMAFADDVATFNRYRLNIDSYLAHSGIPECSEHLLIALYRIGKSRDEAKTVVVVSCANHKIRKLTKEGLRSCPLFQEGGALAHFKIIGKATPPETDREPVPTMQSDTESKALPNNSSEELVLYTQPSRHTSEEHQSGVFLSRDRSATGNNYLGSRILARQRLDQGASAPQSATAGPLVLVDGQSYQLTVQHVANFACPIAQEPCQIADDWDDEDIEDLERNYSSDEDLASWNARTSLPRSSESLHSDMSEAMFSDSSPANSINRNIKLEASEDLDQRSEPFCSGSAASVSGPSRTGESYDATAPGSLSSLQLTALEEQSPLYENAEIDYLLIPTEVELGRVPGSAEILRECGHLNLYELTEARSVIIATATLGYVRGTMFPAPIFSRGSRSQSFQTLFCVQSEKTIPKGASGSAIFDEETGVLAGYITLGCPSEDIWYMTPISTVLEDLQQRLGVQASCQVQLDAASLSRASHNTEKPADRGTSCSERTETCEGTNGDHPAGSGLESQHTLPANGKGSVPYMRSRGQSSDRSPSNNDLVTPPRHTLGWSIRNGFFKPADKSLPSFLPRDKLEEILTYERIIEALGTEGSFPPARQKAIAQEIIHPQYFDRKTQPHLCSRVEILAILALIGKVSTIDNFIEDGLFDNDLPFRYVQKPDSPNGDRSWVMKTCNLERESREIPVFYHWSEKDAKRFESQQWRIHVPVFDGMPNTSGKPSHHTLDQEAIAPYISQGAVGRGGFSTVYKVKIHTQHLPNSDNPHQNQVFAIKKLHTSKRHFDQEVAALKRFAGKETSPLVQLLWTFSLGSTYHLVFPFAERNLYELWRSNEFEFPLAEKKDHDTALWFLRQCLGIAEGLEMIHQGGRDHDSLEPQRFGRHGDIKPENILWFKDSGTKEAGYTLGTLKISDFGMSGFHTTQTSSHVDTDRIGCSVTYRAPEYDVDREISQSYDIWSLGCVFMEFLLWYLKGWDGVDTFSKRRVEEDNNYPVKEDTFFNSIRKGNRTGAVTKISVAMEFQNLYKHKDTSDLIIDFAEFIETDLLRLDPDHRKKCPEVVAQLQRLFDASLRNPDYCSGLSKNPPNRRNTDVSHLNPEVLSPRRGLSASSPRLAPFQNSNPIADSLLEESDTGLDIRVQRNTVGFQPQQPLRPMTDPDSNTHRQSLPYIPKRPVNLPENERDEAGPLIPPNLGRYSGRYAGRYYDRLTRNSCAGNRIL
ncbi:hypothetical protein NW752_002407 [Fusarium irregulare]|uniref:Protein kinase domain-containing protein n=1 Tax=Fusarium irregulare TaxID=2494466 RepID=A0A9W8U5H2_9HYPO|nr:hypothetical protein NW766_011124 [Fusarium irregulare]KAJ4024953.1 hypothetical protein NW752_002407 [Fusarium irregulare]